MSESLSGAAKRGPTRKAQISPVKSPLKHAVRAHHRRYVEALPPGCSQYVSTVGRYYDRDVEAAKAFGHTATHGDAFAVFCSKKEAATVVFDNNRHICSCKQDIGLGAVPPYACHQTCPVGRIHT